jgi:hypothetical protein
MNSGQDEPQNPKQSTEENPQRIETSGGAYIEGDVQAKSFIGRDQMTIVEEIRYDVTGLPNPYLGLRSSTYEDRAAFARTDLK